MKNKELTKGKLIAAVGEILQTEGFLHLIKHGIYYYWMNWKRVSSARLKKKTTKRLLAWKRS